ncbi:MAG: uracil-DNA glycosylase [Proteobacteria bacterium]|nr:uracil-DNA glycosylase [Pseudomonadota bacterium]
MSELPVADETQDNDQQRAVLQLDARRREMLELMGVRLWWPEAKAQPQPGERAEPAPAPQSQAPRQAEAPAMRDASSPAAAPPTPARAAAPATDSRPAPSVAEPATANPRASGAEGLLADAPRLVHGQAGPGGWLIVADLPPDMLGSYPEPLAGDEGKLLGNMLRALRLDTGEQPVHLVRVHRGTGNTSGGDDMPRPFDDQLGAQCAPLAPRVVLALGPLAAQALLRRTGPIGKLRGEAQPLPEGPLAGVPAVASYPLTYLLRNGADKAKAWADLCQAAAQVG